MNSRTVSFASWTPDIIICWASSGRRPRYFTNPAMLAWYVAVVITSEPLWRYLLKQVESIIHQILNSSCHRIEAHKWLIGWRDFRLEMITFRYMYEGKYKCTFKTKFGVIEMFLMPTKCAFIWCIGLYKNTVKTLILWNIVKIYNNSQGRPLGSATGTVAPGPTANGTRGTRPLECDHKRPKGAPAPYLAPGPASAKDSPDNSFLFLNIYIFYFPLWW